VSFSCGGWLQFYLFGVCRAMQSKGLATKNMKYAGCSAGALAAYGIALNGSFDTAVAYCKSDCVPQARASLAGLFDIHKYATESMHIADCLHRYGELEYGKLQVAITKLPYMTKERAMVYETEEDLRNCLLSSCAIYPFAPLVYHRGSWNVDGGMTDFTPLVIGEGITRENTVTVSPLFCSTSDIKPSRYIPFWWALCPPNCSETIDWIYALGYEDGIAYIEKSFKDGVNGVKFEDLPTLLPPISTKNHPYYNVPRTITMNRFLGYSIRGTLPKTCQWLEMVMDLILVFLVVFVWKPLILTLIYIELFIRMVILVANTFVSEISHLISPFTMIVGGTCLLSNFNLFFNVATLMYIRKLLVVGPKDVKRYMHIWKHLTCITSVSLLFRYISGRPSKVFVNNHQVLEEISFMYRMFKYVI